MEKIIDLKIQIETAIITFLPYLNTGWMIIDIFI